MTNAADITLLTKMFEAAVKAADPKSVLPAYLPPPPAGKTVVIGAGKGAAQMAAAFEDIWDGPLQGVVVTRYGYGAPCRHIRVIEAAHPLPDAAGAKATKALLNAVNGLGPDDLVVALICGGGSALLPAPPAGLTLDDEVALNSVLLASGAPISVMNGIRKQVSTIKGGRLAVAAYPAKVVSLVVSDVPGDDPAQIASGPTVPDCIGPQDALNLADTYGVNLPANIRAHIETASPPPQPDDKEFSRAEVHIVASAAQSLEAAARVAEAHGLTAVILSDAIEGEARDVGMVQAAVAREVARKNRPFTKPVVILSGGETTVTLPGAGSGAGGRGGRNTEFLLSAAIGLDGISGVTALSADTDGIDGSEDNAGAFADGTSAARLRQLGHDPQELLGKHDAWGAFSALGDLFVPGPTGTNVNDFRAFIVR